jgi:putative membrane protein
MKSPITLLRTALCTGCLLLPQVVFAQNQPGGVPDPNRPPTTRQPGDTVTPDDDEEDPTNQQGSTTGKQGQTGQQGQTGIPQTGTPKTGTPTTRQGQTGTPQTGQQTLGQTPEQQTGTDMQGGDTLTGIYDFARNEIIVALMGNIRGESPAVKRLSAQMIRDHQRLDDRIVAMAMKQKVELQPKAQMPEQMEDLRDASGADFDRQYIDMIVTTHQQQLDQLTSQLQQSDKKLKPVLQETQRVLKRHLQQAQRVQKQIGQVAAG